MIQKILFISALALATAANAQICNENITAITPDSRFSDNGDGTVTDKQTNLIWMRCSLGQTWGGTTCTGNAVIYSWLQALQEANGYSFAGSSAWRAPNLKELTSIVEIACYDPAINHDVFPLAPAGGFWTASSDASNYSDAWYVNFYYGFDHSYSKSYKIYVRLVRSVSN